jgi:hypothetical protein
MQATTLPEQLTLHAAPTADPRFVWLEVKGWLPAGLMAAVRDIQAATGEGVIAVLARHAVAGVKTEAKRCRFEGDQ